MWELPFIRKCLFIDASQTTWSSKCYLSLWKPKITNGYSLKITNILHLMRISHIQIGLSSLKYL